MSEYQARPASNHRGLQHVSRASSDTTPEPETGLDCQDSILIFPNPSSIAGSRTQSTRSAVSLHASDSSYSFVNSPSVSTPDTQARSLSSQSWDDIQVILSGAAHRHAPPATEDGEGEEADDCWQTCVEHMSAFDSDGEEAERAFNRAAAQYLNPNLHPQLAPRIRSLLANETKLPATEVSSSPIAKDRIPLRSAQPKEESRPPQAVETSMHSFPLLSLIAYLFSIDSDTQHLLQTDSQVAQLFPSHPNPTGAPPPSGSISTKSQRLLLTELLCHMKGDIQALRAGLDIACLNPNNVFAIPSPSVMRIPRIPLPRFPRAVVPTLSLDRLRPYNVMNAAAATIQQLNPRSTKVAPG